MGMDISLNYSKVNPRMKNAMAKSKHTHGYSTENGFVFTEWLMQKKIKKHPIFKYQRVEIKSLSIF